MTDTQTMLRRIEKYANDRRASADKKAADKRKRNEDLKARCSDPELLAQVGAVIEIANAAAKAGIKLDNYVADGIRHKLGLVRAPGNGPTFDAMGILAGGAAGDIDFHMMADGPVAVRHGSTCRAAQEIGPKSVHMERFLKEWPEFMERFMANMDSILPKDA